MEGTNCLNQALIMYRVKPEVNPPSQALLPVGGCFIAAQSPSAAHQEACSPPTPPREVTLGLIPVCPLMGTDVREFLVGVGGGSG